MLNNEPQSDMPGWLYLFSVWQIRLARKFFLCVCHRSYAGARKKDDNKIFCACSAASVDFLKVFFKSVFYERMSGVEM